jgi:Protein of unknown function (DUF1360)
LIVDLGLVLVLGLVVYRGTRILTLDAISNPWREWLHRRVQEVGAENRSFARWGYTLLTCPFCLSVWCSFIAVALYGWLVLDEWLGWEYPFVALAVAGTAALAVSVDMRLNRDAEPGPPLP